MKFKNELSPQRREERKEGKLLGIQKILDFSFC